VILIRLGSGLNDGKFCILDMFNYLIHKTKLTWKRTLVYGACIARSCRKIFVNIYFNFWALSISGGNPGGGGGCCFISRHKVGQAFEVDRKVGANFRRRSESVGWGSKFSQYYKVKGTFFLKRDYFRICSKLW
jgi:hypothetical protein